MNSAVLAVVLALALPVKAPVAEQAGRAFEVKVVGNGPPVLLIPGLSSTGEVWAQTVEALKGRHECHVIQIAGFGGLKAVGGPLVPRVRDELIVYLKEKGLRRPVLIGHSLGGTVALWVASAAPDLVGPVIAVDGVPFLPALMNPAATAESAAQQAAMIHAQYSTMSPEQFAEANAMAMQSMVGDPEALAGLLKMANSSDPRAVGQAVSELFSNDLRAEVAKIRTPVLVVASAPWAVTPELEQRAKAAYEAQVAKIPNHQVVLIPKARHFVMYDAPAALNARMVQFIRGAK